YVCSTVRYRHALPLSWLPFDDRQPVAPSVSRHGASNDRHTMVARSRHLPDLPAQLPRHRRRRRGRPARHHRAARLRGRTGRGRDLDRAVLPLADGGLRLRHRRSLRRRSAVRHARRFRSPAGRGACARSQGDDRPGAQPHLGRARLVPRKPAEPRRGQYYLHNFLAGQPDLNFHHPAVRAAVLDNLRFWLDRGVDGFRLDSINFCFHDALLRDNPAKPKAERTGRGFSADNPYAFQYHWYNNTQPENLAFLEELRALMDRYPGSATLGEISSEDSLATMAEYTSGHRLHMGYSFELLTDDFSAAYIRDTVRAQEAKMTEGWPCWAISNHDVERVLSRWGGGRASAALASQLTAMVCSLRGSVCVYQGEELGLTEAEVPFEALRDPYGIAFWPQFKGRDGCRTPMPWTAEAHGGFTRGAPWLPVPQEHLALAVSRQEADEASTLHGFRAFMQWRHAHPALRTGTIHFLDTPEPVLAFVREAPGETLLVAFNLSDAATHVTLPSIRGAQPLHGHGLREGTLDGEHVHLPTCGALFASLASAKQTDHAGVAP